MCINPGNIKHMFGCFPPKPDLLLSIILFLACAGADAQTPVAENPTVTSAATERTICVSTFAAEKLWFWQHRLNLQDWTISVVVARTTDLKPKTLGNIHWDSDKKTAVIRVLDPADYHMATAEMMDDIEFTVVHELIHLELAPVMSQLSSRNEASRREEEHAVNHMADALLKLQRGR
jgi:hypothetical protein